MQNHNASCLDRSAANFATMRQLAVVIMILVTVGSCGHKEESKPKTVEPGHVALVRVGDSASRSAGTAEVTMTVTHNIASERRDPSVTKGLEVRVDDGNGSRFAVVVLPWYDFRASPRYRRAIIADGRILLHVQPGAFEKWFLVGRDASWWTRRVERADFPVDSLTFDELPMPIEPPLAEDGSSVPPQGISSSLLR